MRRVMKAGDFSRKPTMSKKKKQQKESAYAKARSGPVITLVKDGKEVEQYK